MTARAPDIIAETHDIALGEGWFASEQVRGSTFRWVENDAVVHVAALEPVAHALRVVVEPGPGVGLETFELSARADGAELGTALVSSKQVVTFPLPPQRPAVFSVVLHARGGGMASPNDSRRLNFRVFDMSVERVEDVFPPWAVPAAGFYPLERHAGSIFRWISGDASLVIHEGHGDTLVFDAESGPGLESKPFLLHVLAPDGSSVTTAEIASRTPVGVPLERFASGCVLTLHVDGGGRQVKGDPRILNFRVFAPAEGYASTRTRSSALSAASSTART
jgi:hypothetical protein